MNTEELWLQFHAKLKRFIERKVDDKSIAEDILQDVFLKIHQSGNKLSEVNNIQAWLYRITYNKIVDYYRSQKERSSSSEEVAEVEENHKEHQALAQCMVPFVKRLPDKYKVALMKTDLGGFSQKEYAEEIGISYTGAKSRVQRARRQLKELFTDCCNIHVDKYGTVMDYHSRSK